MRRIAFRFFRFISAVTYWANRRFTAAGALVVSGAVMTGALGVDTTQSAAYQVFGLLAALLAAAALCLPLLRARVYVERELPRVATAGEPFTYRARVRNPGAVAVDGLSLFEDLADTRPAFETFRAAMTIPNYRAWKRLVNAARIARVPEQALPALAPGATTEIEVEAQALKRGIVHSRGVTVARADPLGLMRALTAVPRQANLVVLPRRYALPPFTLPGPRRYQQGGVALAASVGDSREFLGLREYRPGDPLQNIHWKSYARAAKPIVKDYQDEYFERHALVLDTFARPGDERCFEAAVSIAASFACTIETRECLLDLMFIGAEAYLYTAGRGQLQSGSLLEILAAVQPCRDKPFATLGQAALARRQALSGCICVLLGWDEPRRELVHKLRSHGVALRVIAVTEERLEERPPWLLVAEPDKVQESLARL
ncbi:MAG: DUF58 domain-containing protein [Burkholderiales bacterium]